MEATTTERRPKTVDIPREVLTGFRALAKKFRYKQDLAEHCGFTTNTIRSIFKVKTCHPDTLDKLYELTGITNPAKKEAA